MAAAIAVSTAVSKQSILLHRPLSLALNLSTRESDPPLVLYAYKESESVRGNIKFSLEQGLHGSADFIFILDGETDIADLIPTRDDVRIIQRLNICFDLDTFGEVLREDDLWKRYKRFITMNASLRGPFMPYWSTGCRSDTYLECVTGDVKLATDRIGMKSLLYLPAKASQPDIYGIVNNTVAFGSYYEEFHQAIHAEIGATGVIRGAGYKVSAMMSAFQGQQYFDECDKYPKDLLVDGSYFGTNLHPYETIFSKANRGIDLPTLDLLTRLHLSGQQNQSWELCQR
ncbi:hypothetical protein F5Y13DRAFT_204316 [Hypoxylon sp. FL1857]|nr:hypothetical protein F5Y13DRAFT_204316 [Hypoxylon sp. FL1857]